MIGSFFRVLFLAVLGLAVSWAGFLFFPAMSSSTSASDEAGYLDSFLRRSTPTEKPKAEADSFKLDALLPVGVPALQSAEKLMARRLAVSRDLLPFWVVFLAISILAGSLLRERLHQGNSYASPTLSFICKRFGEASLIVFFLWSFAPVPLPYWVFYPALLSTMVATVGYVANLPLRL
jgi:hypothetical protein